MWTSDGVVFIDHAAAKFLDALSHSLLNLGSSVWNADIPGTVGKMIADHRSGLPRPVDNLRERRNRLARGSSGVCSDPMVHLCDMPGRMIGLKKLGAVLASALRHEFGLSFHGPPAAGDSNARVRKFLLDGRNQCIDETVLTRSRTVPRKIMSSVRMVPAVCVDWFGWNVLHNSFLF
jgi:hypothetical protein